jgi:hypothetical protein
MTLRLEAPDWALPAAIFLSVLMFTWWVAHVIEAESYWNKKEEL